MPIGKDTILQGRIFSPLLKFAIPLMLTILLQALYGAVDLIVVGKFGNTTSVSAVANGSQIMQSIIQVIIGLSMGVTVLIGRFVGSKDDESAAETVGGAIKLFFIVGLVISVIMAVLAPQIVVLMKVPAEAAEKTVQYVRICGSGLIFITAYNVISALFRGLGDSKSPLLFISIACVTNIVGDLVLCGVFKLDATGAAIATVLAQAVSVVFSIYKIRKDRLPFEITKKKLLSSKGASFRILKIGGPIALQDFCISFSFLIIIAIMNSLGLVASASIGISEKLFVFLALVPISFMYALSAFVAQNVGAKQEDRAIKGLGAGMIASFAFGIVTFSLTFFAGDVLAGFFENDPIVIAAAQSYMRGTSAEFLLVPFVFCFLGYFNGIGKTNFVLIQGLLSSFAVRIPISYYLSRLPNTDLFTIGLAVPISTLSSILICAGYYVFVRKKRLEMHSL
ncbi:MAG: MATE family efflux transporter [Firmicutes bacterium HGW-Firmicutes-16]|nr:MAG: MATE family efflux transporter [Firmicutes bacterium HGW-Firmicutes-16]